jgi:hypothetical protein
MRVADSSLRLHEQRQAPATGLRIGGLNGTVAANLTLTHRLLYDVNQLLLPGELLCCACARAPLT